MPGLRELLAVILGVLLGIGLLAAPRTALRLSVLVGPTRHRRGDYGTDDTIPDQWTWIVHGLGAASPAVAAFIAYQTYTWLHLHWMHRDPLIWWLGKVASGVYTVGVSPRRKIDRLQEIIVHASAVDSITYR